MAAKHHPLAALAGDVGPLTRIRRLNGQLSGTGQRCAQYLLRAPWDARGQSIREVAAAAGVSVNAVNRFARALGYAGYREFSQALATELGKVVGAAYILPGILSEALEGQALAHDDVATVAQVMAMEARSIQETVQALDRDQVARALEMIDRAKSVLFVGTGTGAAVADLAAIRLGLLGIRASAAADPSDIFLGIHLLMPGDVLIAVSHQGVTRSVVQALEHAHDREIGTICITAVPRSPAAELADVSLTTFGETQTLGLGLFTSRIAAAALLEGLVAAVAWRRRATAPPHGLAVLEAMQRHNTVIRRSRRRPRPSS